MISVEEKIEHLKKHGFVGDFTEIRKMYSGEWFDENDKNYKLLVHYSAQLCHKLDVLTADLNNPEKADEAKKKIDRIVDILFPKHGLILAVRPGLKMLVGQVDMPEDIMYVNNNVSFLPSCLVEIHTYSPIATNVVFGNDEPLRDEKHPNLIKFGKIVVEDNVWICSNVRIKNGAVVGGKSIIALGATVEENQHTKPEFLYVGAPAVLKREIKKDYVSKHATDRLIRSKLEIEMILAHFRNLGIDGNFEQYIRLLNCQEYNCLDPIIQKLTDLAHYGCAEFNLPSTSQSQRDRLIRRMVPLLGNGVSIGTGLFMETAGQVSIGDNVVIGNNATMCGNVYVGNNVTIGNNVALQNVGHPAYWEDRHITSGDNGSLIYKCILGYTRIADGIQLADGTVCGVNVNVGRNTTENEIVFKSI